MFIDWLSVSQEHPHDLPVVCDVFTLTVDASTHEVLSTRQPWFKHEGSYSTSIKISVQGCKVRVEGNPSRIDRQDNLFGYVTIEQCIAVYNQLLAEYGLPAFTRCTAIHLRDGASGARPGDWVADGCVIDRIDLTTNVSVGEGNVLAYLRGLSTQRIGHSVGYLYPNGRTVDWTAAGKRKGGVRLQYRKAYDKAFEMGEHLRPRVLRMFGDESPELAYVDQLISYCNQHGVVRQEQELKQEFLSREGLRYWGLFNENRLRDIHDEFLAVDKKLKVTAMDLATISQQLIAEGVVTSTYAANMTAMVAINWSNGQPFDKNNRSLQKHRARLRQIGIDIANPCDTSRFTPVIVRQAREVTKTYDLPIPDWYRRPVGHLRLVA
ncbi:TPA: hypothetical protein SLV61_005903 [Pseudomonas aeruginosa]|nr:hypothetical protein [Pseudomonas aeruginosa]